MLIDMLKMMMFSLLGAFLVSCTSVPAVPKGQSLQVYLASIPFKGSVLVVKDGHILHQKGYGFANDVLRVPNTKNTQFLIGSLSKQFTALAILQLQDKKLLNIEDTIDSYLPSYPNGSIITIKHLLTNSAGLPDYTDDWENIRYQQFTPDQLINLFKHKPLAFKPGSKVRYSSSGYAVAGKIIEVVSGLTYAQFIEKNIFSLASMTRSAYGLSDNFAIGYKGNQPQPMVDMSVAYAAGALSSTVTDLYLWDRALHNYSLLSKESTALMFPADRQALGLGLGSGKYKVVMGLGWGIYQSNYGPEQAHTGHVDGYTSVISRFPSQNALIVILSNNDQFNVWALKNRIAKAVLEESKI